MADTEYGATTDAAGRYRLEDVEPGRYDLIVRFLGYETVRLPALLVESGKEVVRDVFLTKGNTRLEEVVVSGHASEHSRIFPSLQSITLEETRRFPATFYDPARLAITLPGVVQTNDQANGLSVRGQSPAAFGWRLEGVDIVNPNHTPNAGTFSDRVSQNSGGVIALSAQLLSVSRFYSGVLPPAYGNALSGTMDMYLREGNRERHEYTAQAGLIGLELAAEGPLSGSGNSSFLANYRYSTVGLLGALGVDVGDEEIAFQDFAFHLDFSNERGGRISIFGLGGLSDNIFEAARDSSEWEVQKDRFDIRFHHKLGIAGASLEQTVGDNGFWRTTLVASALKSLRKASRLDDALSLEPRQRDENDRSILGLHNFYQHRLNDRSSLKAGLTLSRRDYRILAREAVDDTLALGDDGGWLWQPYLSFNRRFSSSWQFETGLHFTYFGFNGTGAIEPRLALQWRPAGRHQLKLAYGMQSQLQVPQLYFAGGPANPNRDLGLTRMHQAELGYTHFWKVHTRLNVQLFYQRLFDIPVSAGRASSFSAINLAERIVEEELANEGKAENYGLEVGLRRQMAQGYYFLLNGTLYESIYRGSDGQWRDTRWNGHYALNLTGGREWSGKASRRWGINLRIGANGGFRETPIDRQASTRMQTTVYEEDRAFSIALEDYFRADISVYLKKNRENRSSTLSLDIQNVTNRENVAYRYYDPLQGEVITKLQLGIIPILNYRLEF